MKDNESDYEEMGYQILTIISYTFKKLWFNSENSTKTIPDKTFKVIFSQIVIWFLEKEILRLLLRFDCMKVFQVLELLFEMPCYDELVDNETNLRDLCGNNGEEVDVAQKILGLTKELVLVNDSEIDTNKKASVNIFDEELLEGVKNQINFNYFLLRIACKDKVLLKAKEVFDAVEKLLDPNYEENYSQKQFDTYDMETVLIDVLFRYGPRFLKWNIDAIKTWASFHNFNRLESSILFYHKDYKSAFKILLNLSNSIMVQKFAFAIIKKEMDLEHKSLDKNSERNFKESVLLYLRDQLILDKSESEKVLDILFAYQEMELVENLKGYPDQQFEYIEKLLKKDNFNVDLRDQYQDLMCRLKPKRVIQELYKKNYELDALIDASEKYNIKKALCILYKKIGNYHSAVDVYLQILESTLNKVKDLGVLTIKLEEKLRRVFEDAQELCKEAIEPTCDETENIWFRFINGLIRLYSQNKVQEMSKIVFDQSSDSLIIIELLWKYLDLIVKTMHNYVRIERFHEFYLNDSEMEKLDDKSKVLLFKQLMKSLNYELGVFKYSSESCADSLWAHNNELVLQQRKGYKPALVCQYCHKKLKEDHQDQVMFRVKENYDKECFHVNCRELAFENGQDKQYGKTKESRSMSVSTWDKADGLGDEDDLENAQNDLIDIDGGLGKQESSNAKERIKEEKTKFRMKMKVADNLMKKYDQEVIFYSFRKTHKIGIQNGI